jgi:hypothetical protein
MDTHYDIDAGILTMGMDTYIGATMERSSKFDLALDCPYREIVGCLLWIVLSVNGPDLVRVKDLAKRCNAPSPADYQDALKVLKRLYKRRGAVMLFKRGYAGREWIPSSTCPTSFVPEPTDGLVLSLVASSSHCQISQMDVHDHFDSLDAALDIAETPLPTTTRFTTVAFTDAAFALGDLVDSISGFVIYINCTPVMWGSMKQSTKGDSTCAVEFVAASVCCKQLVHLENMFRFLGFLCVPETISTLHGFTSRSKHCNQR